MDLDTGLLRTFVVLAEELHFTRAADRLQVSQQGLSKRIQRLESLLGSRLVHRTQRNVQLTAAGERLLAPARQVVDAVDAATATVRVADRALRVDVLDDHLWPLQLVRAAAEKGMSVDVVTRAPNRETVDLLRGGDADVAVCRAGAVAGPWPPDLRRRLVLLEPLAVLVGADDPWAARAELAVAELRTRRCWFPMTGAPREWTAFLDELAAEHDIDIEYGGSTMGFDYWVERAAHGSVPPTFIGTAMDLPPVPQARVIPLIDPVPVYPWWVIWRQRLPTRLVEELVAASPIPAHPYLPADAWLPSGDRSYATRDRVKEH
ncbi:MAG: LysR family transcriptional regulator [Nocardioidaceae bacterium]